MTTRSLHVLTPLKLEGWPSYRLEPSARTRRSSATTPGSRRTACALGRPIWRRFAVTERTNTVDALKASFEG